MGRRKDLRRILQEESMSLLVSAKHAFLLPESVIVKAMNYITRWSEGYPQHQPKTLAASAVYLASLHYKLHVPQRVLCEHYDVSLQAMRNFLRMVRHQMP